ncbi:hypothetical protein NDU88_004029 [Pleurodeles waltl]|uniref:Uncharacterized protein n=1 Tax=Pleurodeles waltl TaxID=8319 RepID=A0AAV7V0Q0_PLEWA|nr:hypothetical protein NDU88_004029 [Pleurodeles waltl]
MRMQEQEADSKQGGSDQQTWGRLWDRLLSADRRPTAQWTGSASGRSDVKSLPGAEALRTQGLAPQRKHWPGEGTTPPQSDSWTGSHLKAAQWPPHLLTPTPPARVLHPAAVVHGPDLTPARHSAFSRRSLLLCVCVPLC